MVTQGTTWILNKRVHWKRFGDKDNPTLVLLHGLGRNMTQWKDVVEPLGEHFDVFLFDFLGYGGSDDFELTELNLSFPIWVMDELFRKFGIETPILLGESFGGLLALEYTLKRPGNVSKLALMDSAGLGKSITVKYRLATLPILGEALMVENYRYPYVDGIPLKPMAVLRVIANTIRFWIVEAVFRKTVKTSREVRNNLKLLRFGVNIFGQKKSVRRDSRLKDVSIPVLIMHGVEDDIFPYSQALMAYNQLTNAWGNGPVFFQGGGHFPLNLNRYKDRALGRTNLKKFLSVVIEFGLATN